MPGQDRSERPADIMSSSTALLPKDRKKDDHPIFLRVCHSPWVAIDQKSLVGLRFITAVYLLVSFLMIIDYDLKQNKHGWLIIFDFSNITYFLQVVYAWIAFSWTFMHLHHPHHGSSNNSIALKKFFSPPRQQAATNNYQWFSIFYTAVNSNPHVATAIHWCILVPKNHATIPADNIFGHGWFREFYVIDKWAISSLIALAEVLFFNSIKRANAIWAHFFGITFLSLLYVGWAHIGFEFLDKFAYYFFDHEKVGWDDSSAAIIAFVAAANFSFIIVYALTGVREYFTKKGENKSHGYVSLPQ